MKVGFLITNGGPHPADKWAEITAETILDMLVDANPDDDTPAAAAARKAKRDLRPKLFDVLNSHHEGVQKVERSTLASKANMTMAEAAVHAVTNLDPEPHKPGVMDDVNKVLAQTPWADHFAKPEVQEHLWKIIGQHTVDVMHIERRWHHDRLSAAQGA